MKKETAVYIKLDGWHIMLAILTVLLFWEAARILVKIRDEKRMELEGSPSVVEINECIDH